MVMPSGGRSSAPHPLAAALSLAASVPMALRLALLLLLALVIGLHNAASAQRSDAMGMAEPAVAAMAPPHVGLRAKSMSVSRDQAMPMPGMADAAFGAAEVGGMDGGGGGSRGMNSGVDLPADVTRRRLIETANGEIEVESVRQALERAQTIATQAGGVVVSANERNLSEGGKYGSADIVVRVPVEKFRATWASLLQIAKKVMHSSTAAEDITEQYVDTAVRLKNLEATHAQFLKLLQRATSVQETLEVQRELSRVAGDLEALKGRLTYLDRSASMGTIHLSLHNWARPEERPQAGWSPLVTLKKALSSLVSLSMSMVDGLIYIAVFGGPLVVVCALVGVAYNARTHAA